MVHLRTEAPTDLLLEVLSDGEVQLRRNIREISALGHPVARAWGAAPEGDSAEEGAIREGDSLASPEEEGRAAA